MEMCVLIRVKASCMHITCVNRNMLMDSRISISGLRLRLDLLGSRIPDGWDRIAYQATVGRPFAYGSIATQGVQCALPTVKKATAVPGTKSVRNMREKTSRPLFKYFQKVFFPERRRGRLPWDHEHGENNLFPLCARECIANVIRVAIALCRAVCKAHACGPPPTLAASWY
eukprot:scaffold270947_cov30-Tisochrysis_lutea.AAC.2